MAEKDDTSTVPVKPSKSTPANKREDFHIGDGQKAVVSHQTTVSEVVPLPGFAQQKPSSGTDKPAPSASTGKPQEGSPQGKDASK